MASVPPAQQGSNRAWRAIVVILACAAVLMVLSATQENEQSLAGALVSLSTPSVPHNSVAAAPSSSPAPPPSPSEPRQPHNFPWPFPEHPERFLVFDAFIRGPTLYMVSTWYALHDIPFADVGVSLDGAPITGSERGANEYEPARAFIFPLPDGDHHKPRSVRVTHTPTGKSVEFVVVPDVEQTPRVELAVGTMFQASDSSAMREWYAYYKGQGVQQFYMYFRNESGGGLPADVVRAPDVHYAMWPYRYNNPKGNAEEHFHLGQVTFMTELLYRYIPVTESLLFLDLDEFMQVKPEVTTALAGAAGAGGKGPTTLREYLALPPFPPSRIVGCTWAAIQSRTPQALEVNANMALAEGYLGRTKTIYRSDFTGLMGVHFPKDKSPPNAPKEEPNLFMFHITNLFHFERADRVTGGYHATLPLLPAPA